MSVKKRKYSNEFKAEAVELAEKIGVTKASKDLGINSANIQRWRSEGRTSTGQPKTVVQLEKEIRRLQKENGYLKKINDVLKKSTAIFSIDHIHDSK